MTAVPLRARNCNGPCRTAVAAQSLNAIQRLDVETDDDAIRAIAESFNEMLDELGAAVARAQHVASVVDERTSFVLRARDGYWSSTCFGLLLRAAGVISSPM